MYVLYVSQWHGRPVTPPGTGFHFLRLLRLAGLWWRYTNPHAYVVSTVLLVKNLGVFL
jgi:hypothetical protein